MITESDVRWAYRYYFGRKPDSEQAVAHHLQAHGHDKTALRRAFFTAPESLDRVGFPTPFGEFCVWRPDRPKLLVAGNCLGPNLARAAATMTDLSIYGFDVLNFPDKQEELIAWLDSADYLLLPLLGEQFGILHWNRAREAYGSKVAFYSSPYFEGVHPDITYLGERGSRIRSPVGDYHSRVVLRCFANGLTPFGCMDAIADGAILDLRPKDIFNTSKTEFLRREEDADIKIGPWFFKNIRKLPLLYTINHPTGEVLIEILRQALKRFGQDCKPPHPSLMQTTLSSNVIWPVPPDVARALGLDYSTSDLIYADGYAMTFQEYVMRAYELYERAGHEQVSAAARERNLI